MTFASATVSSASNSAQNWAGMVLRELGRSQAGGFLLDVTLWTLLGGVFGLLLAVASCVLFSRLGWYDVKMRFARGVRWTVFALTVLISAILFGLAGLWSGALHGSERVLSKSQLATEVFPLIADVVADAVAWVQVHASSADTTNSAALSAKLDEFRAGKWELHAAQFLQQLDQLKEGTITNAVARLEQSALEHTPMLRGGLGEKLLHQFVGGLGRVLVERKMASEMRGWGADRVYSALREQLKSEAAKSGDPDTIGRGEISQLVIREGIVPGIMTPIRSTARAQQVPLIALAATVMIMPPVCVRVLKGRFARRPKPVRAEPSTPPVVR